MYNAALAERRDAWQKNGVIVTYTMQANQLRQLRRVCPDAAFLNFSSMKQTPRRLDKAFNAFFRRVKKGEKPGYLRFKGKGWHKSVAYIYDDGMRLKDGRLYVQNMGPVRIFQHCEIPEDATFKSIILKRDCVGKLAEIMNTYLAQGDRVYIEGWLQTDRYEKDGETRHFTKVVARNLIMLGSNNEGVPPEERTTIRSEFVEVYPG